MAHAPDMRDPQYLHGLVDMGSNGIRFSISSLAPPTARIMPTLYQNRVGISLYDAQYASTGERIPIDEPTIQNVILAMRAFQRTCHDFQVPETQITVLATEATRTALNSEALRQRIRESVGWDVTMLAKEEEGRVGALGVASSLPEVRGLVMDLGGGSTQLSWLVKERDSGRVSMPDAVAVSLPYGAAAMTRRLAEAEREGTLAALEQEVHDSVTRAYASLQVPAHLEQHARDHGGFTLYLSGGGFRGWGYMLMSQHPGAHPYPIPAINGFRAPRHDFLSTDRITTAAAAALLDDDDDNDTDIFRVSDRRASQVPAVAFLIDILARALPHVQDVRFCQGGVREGYLFSLLPDEIRAQHPLVVATQSFDTTQSSASLAALLHSALPPPSPTTHPVPFDTPLLTAFASLLHHHSSHPKDLRPGAALRTTTSGPLASVHGLLHESRILLSLLLCARWPSALPPSDTPFLHALESVTAPASIWWCRYLGAVAALIAEMFPASRVVPDRLALAAQWVDDKKVRPDAQPHPPLLLLQITITHDLDHILLRPDSSLIRAIEKIGKRKRWVGGREGVGFRVRIEVARRAGAGE